jgi:hypothetical protein
MTKINKKNMAPAAVGTAEIEDGSIGVADLAPAVQAQLGTGLPAGIVMPFAGVSTNVPAGFIWCDGRELSKTEYPALWAALNNGSGTGLWDTCPRQQSPWGSYSAPTAGNFRVPDLRTQFLRGAGTNQAGVATPIAGYLADATALSGITATAAGQTIGQTYKLLNSGSAGSIASEHSHNTYNGVGGNAGTGIKDAYTNSTYRGQSEPAGGAHTHGVTGQTDIAHTHAASAVSFSGAAVETRPDCAGVNYIIKA